MGNACFSHCSKKTTGTTKTREASFVSFAPISDSSSDSTWEPNNSYYQDDDYDDDDELFYDSEAYTWFDAFENFPTDEQQQDSFTLSMAALKMIRIRLKDSFPNDRNFLNDDYIKTMACQAYLKDRNPRRAIETCIESLSTIMKWRNLQDLSELPHLVSMAVATKEQRQRWRVSKSQLQKARSLVASLNTVGGYWHGLTKEGRPILWIHTQRLRRRMDDDDDSTTTVVQAAAAAQLMALQLLADVGIQYGMPSGISNVCVIIIDTNNNNKSSNDGTNSPTSTTTAAATTRPLLPNKDFVTALLQALTEGYPHRIHQVWIATTIPAAVAVLMDRHNVMKQLMDTSIILCETMQECREGLVNVLWNGWEDMPTFLGGPNTDHDQLYSITCCEAKKKNEEEHEEKGDSLTFDFYGMKDRMMEHRTEYEER